VIIEAVKKLDMDGVAVVRFRAGWPINIFFFYGCYSPWWILACFTIALHFFRSCDYRLQFLKPIVFKSSSTESSHPIAGLPTRWVPSGLYKVNCLQGFCSCILKRCPSHLNRPTLITFAIFGSLYYLYSSRLYLDLHIPFPLTGP
jgi:hypothetical protein